MVRRNFIKTGLAGMGALAVPGIVQAMPQSSNKKWAVLYGSSCGSTREYAGYINEGMGGIADVVDIATTTPKVSDYEYFVIGGWRSGNKMEPVKIPDFVKNNKAELKDKLKGFFVVLGNGGVAELKPEMTSFLNSMLVTPSGVSNKPSKVLFGRSDPACNKLSITYDNVKKADGLAFGKQIIDAAVGTLLDGSHQSTRFALSHTISPFTSLATISYALPRSAAVQLTVSALNGRQIATLVSSRQEAGNYNVKWNIGDIAPGIYLYRLETTGFTESRIANIAAR